MNEVYWIAEVRKKDGESNRRGNIPSLPRKGVAVNLSSCHRPTRNTSGSQIRETAKQGWQQGGATIGHELTDGQDGPSSYTEPP